VQSRPPEFGLELLVTLEEQPQPQEPQEPQEQALPQKVWQEALIQVSEWELAAQP
jgi:hypothetical protein